MSEFSILEFDQHLGQSSQASEYKTKQLLRFRPKIRTVIPHGS